MSGTPSLNRSRALRSFAQKQSPPHQTRPAGQARSAAAQPAPQRREPSILNLQRSVGNGAVQRMLRSQGSGAVIELPRLASFVHPVAASLARPGARFRVPSFANLKAAYTDKTLKIPEAVIKDRIGQLLGRMKREGRLKSADPVATIVAKIFPGPGKIDEAEFNKAIDVADRTKIYQSVVEADTKVKAADKPKLQTAMQDAADLVKKVEGDAAGLKQVFGAQDAAAKTCYAGARKVLEDLAKDLGSHVTTDYNLDDPEVSLGGFAIHSEQKMHLLLRVAQVDDPKDTKATVIHEATHFANASVDDQVYYANAGFFELDEASKVANAAHYEELPRREMKTSKFDKKTFTPGVTPGGGAVTREDKVKAATNRYLRMAWDAGVDAHMFIRGVRREYLAGNNKPFNDHKALILEISKLMDLTVHEQAAGKAIVTTLDVTLSESISRGVAIVGSLANSVPFPSPVGALTDIQLRDKIAAAAVTKYGELLKNAARDKALLDWLSGHFRILPSI
jgi:hypothetical protein